MTLAMFADPDGQTIGLIKSDPAEDPNEIGPSQGQGTPVDWFEILGSDAARTQRFFTELFGWTIENSDFPGYALIDTGSNRGIRGGVGSEDGSQWVTVYASVSDIDASLKRAEELGGRKVYGPNSVGEGMLTAAFKDPAGNVFGLYQR